MRNVRNDRPCKHGVIGPCGRCGTRKGVGEHEGDSVCIKCGLMKPRYGWRSKCKGTVGISLWR